MQAVLYCMQNHTLHIVSDKGGKIKKKEGQFLNATSSQESFFPLQQS